MALQCQPLAEARLPLAAAPSLHWTGWASLTHGSSGEQDNSLAFTRTNNLS